MRPIKQKGILHKLTIRNQKLNQNTSVESALKIDLIFFYFEDNSKSAWGMILFLLVTCYCTPLLHKTAEKPTVMRLFTQNCFKCTVRETTLFACFFAESLIWGSFLP